MPKWKVKLKGQNPMTKEADHLAYEGPAVILYNSSPYDPVYVVMNWEAQIVPEEDDA